MKVISINNIMYITDDDYSLIIIQEAGGMLIYIVSSYSLVQ